MRVSLEILAMILAALLALCGWIHRRFKFAMAVFLTLATLLFWEKLRASGGGGQFTVIQWEDLHISTGSNFVGDFTNAVTWMLTNTLYNIKAVVLAGDLVNAGGDTNAYMIVTNQLDRLRAAGICVVPCPGNHEMGASTNSVAADIAAWNSFFGTNWYAGDPFFVGQWNTNDSNDTVHGSAYAITNNGTRILFVTTPVCISNAPEDNPTGYYLYSGSWDTSMSWSNSATYIASLAASHPAHQVVVLTHDFINTLGNFNTTNYLGLWIGDGPAVLWKHLSSLPNLSAVWSGHARHTAYHRLLPANDNHLVHCSYFNMQASQYFLLNAKLHTIDTSSGIVHCQTVLLPSSNVEGLSGLTTSFTVYTNGVDLFTGPELDMDYWYPLYDAPRAAVLMNH